MRRKSEKIPEEWVKCPKCDRFYGFIRCRITKGGKSQCLTCAVEESKTPTGA